jgi:hypothetical protein
MTFDASRSEMQFEAQQNPQFLSKASTKLHQNLAASLVGQMKRRDGSAETWNVFFG